MLKSLLARTRQLLAMFDKSKEATSTHGLLERLTRPKGSATGVTRRLRHIRAIGAVVLAYAIATPIARRRGYMIGRNTIVRCRSGHLFTTMWIPGASLKSLRLGPVRFQRCPVGRHWTFVVPVKTSSLTEAQQREAESNRDVRIP